MKNIGKGAASLILLSFVGMSFIQHTQFLDLEVQGIHSWRQSQTMWNIRNFVRHDNNICNPRINKFNGGKSNILRYEFPLMQWTIAQVQKAINEEIRVVRIMMFLMGLLTLFSFMGTFIWISLPRICFHTLQVSEDSALVDCKYCPDGGHSV